MVSSTLSTVQCWIATETHHCIPSLVARLFTGEMAWQLTRVQKVYGYDVKETIAAPHVIFDCSRVTVRNVQAHCCCQQDQFG